jgi:NADPH-dependent F420 reductase
MRIGILGSTGPAGSALGARLASVGYEVVLGSRSKERGVEVRDALVAKWPDLDLPLVGGDNADAAACDLVVVATPWDSASSTVRDLRAQLEGKVVISMANALTRTDGEFQPLIPPRGSVAVHVQAALPNSQLVATFHHLPAKELGHLGSPVESDVLVCSDFPEATAVVSQIVSKIPGCRALDAGSLSNASALEALTAVMLNLNMRYKTRVAPKFTGIRE